jgi:hypothetical protein
MFKKQHTFLFLFLLTAVVSFSQASSCLDILPNPDSGNPSFSEFDRYIHVLGTIKFYAEPGVSDAQLLHAASIGAELLDNDENGVVDDVDLADQLISINAVMPLFSDEGSPAENAMMDNWDDSFCVSAVLYSQEISPWAPVNWFEDACLEEILHTINVCGHVELYPVIFAIVTPGASQLCQAMDIARGGQFIGVPGSYPESAWYHYNDVTCDYHCMAIEYLYWCIATDMGVLNTPGICAAIEEEWEPCSPELFENIDVMMHSIVNNPAYKLPQLAPNGIYCPTNDVPQVIKSNPEVFPNPSNGRLIIQLNSLTSKVSSVMISDYSGRAMMSHNVYGSSPMLALDLPEAIGYYIMTFLSNSGESLYTTNLIIK